MTDVLANAVWHSLLNAHAPHADGHGVARRYDPDVSVFHGIDEPSDDAWDDLAALATNGVVVLFRESPLPEPPCGVEGAVRGRRAPDGAQEPRC